MQVRLKKRGVVARRCNAEQFFFHKQRRGGERGGAGGAGGESFELNDKAGAEEEGEEALRVAEWIAWREEIKGEKMYGGSPQDAQIEEAADRECCASTVRTFCSLRNRSSPLQTSPSKLAPHPPERV